MPIPSSSLSDAGIRDAILALLAEVGPDKSISPTDVARRLLGTDETVWRRAMSPVRRVAIAMAGEGVLELVRKGKKVAAADLKGVYRLRLATIGQEEASAAAGSDDHGAGNSASV